MAVRVVMSGVWMLSGTDTSAAYEALCQRDCHVHTFATCTHACAPKHPLLAVGGAPSRESSERLAAAQHLL